MNREIKFRAWDAERKEMFYPSNLTTEIYKRNQSVNLVCRRFTGDSNSILMQYTGITDRKGKEIYEGDIINDSGKECVVKFNDGNTLAFWLDSISEGLGYLMCSTESEWYEVIGNIYENPELLTR